MKNLVQSVQLAILWFTRIPLPAQIPDAARLQQQSLAWLACIGLLVGSLPVLVFTYANGWGPWITGLFALGAQLLLTGALHEDGWADGWDALGAGGPVEKTLHVLKDPRLGTFGVSALAINLALQWIGMVTLAEHKELWVIPLLHVVSRYPLALMAWKLPYVRRDGEGKAGFLHEGTERWAWWIWAISGLALAIIAAWLGERALILVATTLTAGAVAYWPWWKRLRGVTGDIFGFCQQSALLAGYLAATWGLL